VAAVGTFIIWRAHGHEATDRRRPRTEVCSTVLDGQAACQQFLCFGEANSMCGIQTKEIRIQIDVFVGVNGGLWVRINGILLG
jgi:hypothetical protein